MESSHRPLRPDFKLVRQNKTLCVLKSVMRDTVSRCNTLTVVSLVTNKRLNS